MKRSGIINSALLAVIGRLGHGDTFCVADCGLPVPPDVRLVDLSVTMGVPPFLTVLDALRDELVVEQAVAAHETDALPIGRDLTARFPDLVLVSHEELKAQSAACRFVVRTGEARPYANVILRAGVPFA